MLDSLVAIDHELLLHVNGLAGNSTIDSLMMLISGKWVWIPLYAYLLYALIQNFTLSSVGWIVLSICALVILTDQGSVELFKEYFQRLRPCHNRTRGNEAVGMARLTTAAWRTLAASAAGGL